MTRTAETSDGRPKRARGQGTCLNADEADEAVGGPSGDGAVVNCRHAVHWRWVPCADIEETLKEFIEETLKVC